MIRDVDEHTANVFLRVVNAQKEHLRQLEALRKETNAAQGDVALPRRGRPRHGALGAGVVGVGNAPHAGGVDIHG